MKIMITYTPTFFAIKFQENSKTDPVILNEKIDNQNITTTMNFSAQNKILPSKDQCKSQSYDIYLILTC